MVLAAVRLAPVGYVAALRESSVVLGALAGWLFLHERMGRARLRVVAASSGRPRCSSIALRRSPLTWEPA